MVNICKNIKKKKKTHARITSPFGIGHETPALLPAPSTGLALLSPPASSRASSAPVAPSRARSAQPTASAVVASAGFALLIRQP